MLLIIRAFIPFVAGIPRLDSLLATNIRNHINLTYYASDIYLDVV